MPAPNHERQIVSSKAPTSKQLAYLKALAERTGQTFAVPRTSRDASAEIERLERVQPGCIDSAELDREIADAVAIGEADATRFRSTEFAGYGSSATWSRR
jgi:hypothetical protein